MIKRTDENMKSQSNEDLFNALKSKDKKTRYFALDEIMKLSRSNKTLLKNDFLKRVLSKSSSLDWEERYVAMYAVSRFYLQNWEFDQFKMHFLNALKLNEDADGRVRVAAKNTLDHFRTSIMLLRLGIWKTNDEKIIRLWKDSLFALWEKIVPMEKGKLQLHLIECIKIFYLCGLEGYLSGKDCHKYWQTWKEINELNQLYYGY
jgi:hypothetical protein